MLCMSLVTPLAPAHADNGLPQIAIIIDDLGYRKEEGLRALALPGPVTYAFLPHTPHALQLASKAHADDKEVILHLPMEADRGETLGPGGVTVTMSEEDVMQSVTHSLSALPHVRGISNHMGSLLSTNDKSISWIMTAVKSYDPDLYFVDSRTTADSVITRIADDHAIANVSRDIFLDHDLAPSAIWGQFEKLLTQARKRGNSIGIAHPHPTTLSVLERVLPRLASFGVELVPVSTLVGSQGS